MCWKRLSNESLQSCWRNQLAAHVQQYSSRLMKAQLVAVFALPHLRSAS